MQELRGIIVPLATPFTAGGEEVDYAAYRRHIDQVIGSGVAAIIANAATGQFAYLSDAERTRVAVTAIEQAAGRIPVLVGAGAASTHQAIRWTRHAESLGAAGVMIMPPYYGATPADVAVRHYAAVSDACPLPIMIYNAPYASHVLLQPEHIEQIVAAANIPWVKLTTGVIDHVTALRLRLGDRVSIYEGVDTLAFPSFCLGADGWVAGPGNMIPEICREMWRRVQGGDIAAARRLQNRVYPLLQAMRENMGYFAVINEVCRLRGLDLGPVRLPGCELGPEHRQQVRDAAATLGLPGVPVGALDARSL
ncbi:MAG: dihydrodipicolinate synthase family protein [Dongiaceae bacterium]